MGGVRAFVLPISTFLIHSASFSISKSEEVLACISYFLSHCFLFILISKFSRYGMDVTKLTSISLVDTNTRRIILCRNYEMCMTSKLAKQYHTFLTKSSVYKAICHRKSGNIYKFLLMQKISYKEVFSSYLTYTNYRRLSP